MGKKVLLPLTANQTSTGPSNAVDVDYQVGNVLLDNSSGFLKVGNFELINVDIVTTGAAVNLKYSIESLDYWNNVVQVHTGEFLSAGNAIIEIEHNARQALRTNLTEYNSGAFYASIHLSSYNYR